MWIRIIIFSLVIIFIFVIGFLCGIVNLQDPDQQKRDDEEQLEYLAKWREERKLKKEKNKE